MKSNETGHDVSGYIVPNLQPFICTLTFEKSATVRLASGDYFGVTNSFDFMADAVIDPETNVRKFARGGFKFERNLNKNAIYVQLPVGDEVSESADPSTEGGYGYDLGFVQDNFVLELQTTNYLDYQKFFALVKTNTGETPATLTIGYNHDEDKATAYTNPYDTESYKVLVRYCNASTTPGSQVIKINVTLTVVSTEYNT